MTAPAEWHPKSGLRRFVRIGGLLIAVVALSCGGGSSEGGGGGSSVATPTQVAPPAEPPIEEPTPEPQCEPQGVGVLLLFDFEGNKDCKVEVGVRVVNRECEPIQVSEITLIRECLETGGIVTCKRNSRWEDVAEVDIEIPVGGEIRVPLHKRTYCKIHFGYGPHYIKIRYRAEVVSSAGEHTSKAKTIRHVFQCPTSWCSS